MIFALGAKHLAQELTKMKRLTKKCSHQVFIKNYAKLNF